ncbi:MAG: DUF4388 domain-containing protein [Thermodesulfobacteriota bacterium]
MFAGTLKTLSIPSLIQTCSSNGSSGTMEFSSKKVVMGRIGFENGDINNANFLDINGINAVKQLTLLEELDFELNEKIISPKKNINVDINFLLIECARYKDEIKEYLKKIKTLFSIEYNIGHVIVYKYRHFVFTSPEIFKIKYFEAFDGKNFIVVYLDKNIDARIELLFKEPILTNDLLMFMQNKDVFNDSQV